MTKSFSTLAEIKIAFYAGQLGKKEVFRWDEYGNGWWVGDVRVMSEVPENWPFDSAGFPNDWEKYAKKVYGI